MKIVCDNCATKYSIADEKVRGKVFKIRCKKCSHIIVVRGGADGNAEPARDTASSTGESFPVEDQQTMAARGGGVPAGGATGDAVWHLVIDREQVGPMTPAEVRQKFSDGAVDVETYAWREGFGDWLRLGSIEDFRDLGGGAPAGDEGATRRTDSADLFAAAGGADESASPPSEGAGDLFGGGGAPAASAYASSPAPSEDVFGGGGALFGAPSAQPAPSRPQRTSSPGFAAQSAEPAVPSGGAVEVRPMTGQRNENSVLFSLNNLQALATGGGGAKAPSSSSSSSSSSSGGEPRPGFANSQTEGSGLIDIRAMAASTLAASPSTGGSSGGKSDDLPGLGAAPVFSPMAAPILMPAAPSGPPKWMWAILGVGVAAVLGIVVVGILLLTKKGPEPAVAAAPTGTVPAAAAPSAAAPAAAAPAAAAPAATAQAPGAGAPVAANDSAKDEKGAKHHKGGAAAGVKLAKNDAPKAESAAPPPAAAAPAPAAPAPAKKGGKKDALDDLLDGATGGSDTPKPRKKAAAADDGESGGAAAAGGGADLPDQLDKGQIVGGMGRIKGRVAACYDQFKVPGMANVSVTIGNSGHVSNATVGGAFSGTPTGDCVARAVKSATFPRFKGAAQTINYPFILR